MPAKNKYAPKEKKDADITPNGRKEPAEWIGKERNEKYRYSNCRNTKIINYFALHPFFIFFEIIINAKPSKKPSASMPPKASIV